MLRALVLCVVCLAVSIGARANDAKLGVHGVWKGSIGNLPIMACFKGEDSYHFGAYYYLSHLQLIHLEDVGSGKVWFEAKSQDKVGLGTQWKLEVIHDNEISGMWSAHGKELPITLTRITEGLKDGDGQEATCGSDAFFKPRITQPKIIEKPASLDGQAYIDVEVDAGKQFDVNFKTFKLQGKSAEIAAVNELLLAQLPKPGDTPRYVDCIRGGSESGGQEGNFDVSIAPTILTPHWLVASSGDGSYCGGAHPINSCSEEVYDLRQGKAVELKKWFSAGTFDTDGKLLGKLLALVKSQYIKDAGNASECADSVKGAEFWGLSLAKKGMNFTPSLSYAETACMDPVTLSFKTVDGFLNADGKRQLANFSSELAK
jgi:hypothetical protein